MLCVVIPHRNWVKGGRDHSRLLTGNDLLHVSNTYQPQHNRYVSHRIWPAAQVTQSSYMCL